MKTILNKIMAIGGIALLALVSCKKDGNLVTVNSSSTKATTLATSTTTPALVKANLTTNAITFTATAADYGYKASITYTLQLAVKGTNFAAPKEVVLSGLTQSYNVQDFNNLLLAMNLPTGTVAQIDTRIKSSLSTTDGIVYSNVVTLTATPFALVSYIYIVGSFQSWNATSPDSLVSATGNGIYTGIINFTTGNRDFLILPAKNFNNKYATNDPVNTTSSTVTYNAPNNFFAPATAGFYTVTLNLNTNTISFATPANYYSVIGDAAVDWNTDIDMKYNVATSNWELTRAFLSTGGFKIRMNHDWGTSWGFQKTPDGATLTSDNGGNMSVATTGNYKIVFKPTYDATGKVSQVNSYTLTKQ